MRKHATGFLLIEVLIAFLVLGMGIVGIARVLFSASKASNSTYFQVQATQFAQNLVEAMRQNTSAAKASNSSYNYSFDTTTNLGGLSTSATACITASCDPSTLAKFDLFLWCNALRASLPAPTATVALGNDANNNSTIQITINWNDLPTQQVFNGTNSANNTGTASITLRTLL